MRRPLIAATSTLVAALLLTSMALAQVSAPRTSAKAGENNETVIITNPGFETPGSGGRLSRSGGTGGRRGGAGQPLPEYVIKFANIRNPNDSGGRCLETSATRRDTPMTAAENGEYGMYTSFARNAGIPTCDELAAGPEATPAGVAEPFVRAIPLPRPEPHIAPDGKNITGLPAYLETNGTLTHSIGPAATELGPITVEATGAYWVDWGDGSPEAGPFNFEGEPYPSGRISHNYQFTGTYTVTLRQTWNAQWRLGGDSGTVEDLQTEASIPLEVHELQAVIVR